MNQKFEVIRELRMFVSYLQHAFPLSKMMGVNLHYDKVDFVLFSEN